MSKDFISATAIVLTFVAFYPYIRSIRLGQTRPHVLSWIIWGVTTLIVSFAQMAGAAGVGAWPITFSGIITLYVAFLAYRVTRTAEITRLDWVFLASALSALPLWYISSNPLTAVLILTFVDLLGFGPTFRKAYDAPYTERLGFFALMTLRNLLSIWALEHYSWTTVVFPAAIALACLAFIAMVFMRRLVVPAR